MAEHLFRHGVLQKVREPINPNLIARRRKVVRQLTTLRRREADQEFSAVLTDLKVRRSL
jgi:hypothetical protein